MNAKTEKTYTKITEKIVELLEQGTAPWKKGWSSVRPQNYKTGRPYRGINRFLTSIHMEVNGYTDPRYITFNAQKALGGSVKGQKGLTVVFWKWINKEKEDSTTGEKKTVRYPIAGAYTVFNVEQVSGVDFKPFEAVQNDNPPLEQAEKIFADFLNAPEFKTSGGDRAYYSPSKDLVHLPTKELFKSSEAYYSVLFHELTHSTGHPSRLGRFDLTADLAPFGSEDYGKEELIAELGAAFLCAECGIETEQEQSAAYVAGWLRNIKKDVSLVPAAAQAAQKAVDHILNIKSEYDD